MVNHNEILCHKLCVVSPRSHIIMKTVKRLIILQLKDDPLLISDSVCVVESLRNLLKNSMKNKLANILFVVPASVLLVRIL